MLSQPMPRVSTSDAEALARDLFNLHGIAHPLAGERDCNFRLIADGRNFVLKVIHPDEDLAIIHFQNCALQHIAAHNPRLPVPRVLLPANNDDNIAVWRTDDYPDRGVQCLTFLEGHSLDLAPGSATQRRNLGIIQAQMNRALSNFCHPAETREILWDTKHADKLYGLCCAVNNMDIRVLATQAIDRFTSNVLPILPKLRSQIIHNDLNPHNVLVTGDTIVGIIDFGDIVKSPLVQDLATSCAYQIMGYDDPLKIISEVVAGFHEAEPIYSEELEVLIDFVCARLALILVIGDQKANRDPSNARYLLRNRAAAATALDRILSIPSSAIKSV